MDLYSLTGKDGQIQISIVHCLLKNKLQTSVSSILQELSISRFIFEKQIDELQDVLATLDIGLEVAYSQSTDQLTLTKQNDTTLEYFYFYYLQQTIEYKLLDYLYFHPKFSVTKLADYLALSEAAIYRKINLLNKWMQEFDIAIKRGKIVGSELQICYFFFKLIWNAFPLELIEERVHDLNSIRFVEYLENQLQQEFSYTSKVKLYLWIRISKIRLKAIDRNAKELDPIIKNFLAHQTEDPLYQIIKDAYFLSMSHSASFGSEYKSIYLYFFITSIFIMDVDNVFFAKMGYWPTFNTKIIEMNETVTNKVKNTYNISVEMIDPNFIKNWKYVLTQIHGIAFYFKGNITIFDEELINNNLLENTIHTPDFILVNEIITTVEEVLGRPLRGTVKELIRRFYLYFIYEMRRFSRKNLKIGVIYTRDYLQSHIMMQNIKAEFEVKLPVTCEIAKIDEHYDLLITDSKIFTIDYHYEELYIINDFKTSADSSILLSLLKQLLAKEGT